MNTWRSENIENHMKNQHQEKFQAFQEAADKESFLHLKVLQPLHH